VSIFGPATADFWWPDTVGSAANAKWDKISHRYFNILTQGNVHPWMRGSAPLGDMELRRDISAKGHPWVDHHFADTGPNCFKMSMILTNLVIWQQFLCNMREVAMALGRTPSDDRSPRWISGSNRGLRLNPYYQRRVTLSAEASLATSVIAYGGAIYTDLESSNVIDESNKTLAMLANLKVPEEGDYYRCHEDAAVYDDKGLTTIVGKLGATKTVGPILAFTTYRRDTSSDMVAGLAVQFFISFSS